MPARLSYSNVTATIALFVALGGSAYAATQLPKASVGAKQLRKNAVTGAKVRDRSLTGRDIELSTLGTVPVAASAQHADGAPPSGAAGGALTGSYPNPAIAAHSLSTNDLADGAVTGAKLGAGIPHDITTVVGGTPSSTIVPQRSTSVSCPTGEVPISGGAAAAFGEAGQVVLTSSHPETVAEGGSFDGWFGAGLKLTAGAPLQQWGIQVYAVCARF